MKPPRLRKGDPVEFAGLPGQVKEVVVKPGFNAHVTAGFADLLADRTFSWRPTRNEYILEGCREGRLTLTKGARDGNNNE